jgi:hypothetical protein
VFAAIGWAGRYLAGRLLVVVQTVALVRSGDRDIEHAARRLKLGSRTVRRDQIQALAVARPSRRIRISRRQDRSAYAPN